FKGKDTGDNRAANMDARLAFNAGVSDDPFEEAAPAPKASFTPAYPSIEERLKWLARTQNVNGSWGENIEWTAAALLAFVRAGHTTRTGSYRQQVKKAANWLQSGLAKTTGFVAFAVLRALDELQASTGDTFVSDDMRNRALNPASIPERAASGD